MNIKARVLPRYFEELKKGNKTVDYRQFELITLENTDTGEQLVFEIKKIYRVDATTVIREYPDVPWITARDIYAIELGERV